MLFNCLIVVSMGKKIIFFVKYRCDKFSFLFKVYWPYLDPNSAWPVESTSHLNKTFLTSRPKASKLHHASNHEFKSASENMNENLQMSVCDFIQLRRCDLEHAFEWTSHSNICNKLNLLNMPQKPDQDPDHQANNSGPAAFLSQHQFLVFSGGRVLFCSVFSNLRATFCLRRRFLPVKGEFFLFAVATYGVLSHRLNASHCLLPLRLGVNT